MYAHSPRDPQLLARIGLFFVNWGSIETNLHIAFKVLMDDPGDLEHAILSPAENFSIRLSIIMNVAEEKKEDRAIAPVLLEKREKITQMNSFRNRLAHSSFVVIDGETHTMSYVSSARGKPKLLPLKGEDIVEVNTLGVDVNEALEPHIMEWGARKGHLSKSGPLAALHGRLFPANPDIRPPEVRVRATQTRPSPPKP